MYEIYIDGKKVMETQYPCYIYYDNNISSFRTCEEPKAEAICITDEEKPEEEREYFADIDYKPYRHEGFPIATIIKK